MKNLKGSVEQRAMSGAKRKKKMEAAGSVGGGWSRQVHLGKRTLHVVGTQKMVSSFALPCDNFSWNKSQISPSYELQPYSSLC